ncbi:MAG: hypothetical protein ABR510_08650 [Trueperaceae bacterium]
MAKPTRRSPLKAKPLRNAGLEPKELRGWLAREPHMIPPKDVALIHSRLKLVARGGD